MPISPLLFSLGPSLRGAYCHATLGLPDSVSDGVGASDRVSDGVGDGGEDR